MDFDAAATLSNSSLTAYIAVKNAGLSPYDNVVIVCPGGLGLMAMQLAKAVIAARIITLDLDDSKLMDARKEGGADDVINSSKEEPAKAVKDTTNGLVLVQLLIL